MKQSGILQFLKPTNNNNNSNGNSNSNPSQSQSNTSISNKLDTSYQQPKYTQLPSNTTTDDVSFDFDFDLDTTSSSSSSSTTNNNTVKVNNNNSSINSNNVNKVLSPLKSILKPIQQQSQSQQSSPSKLNLKNINGLNSINNNTINGSGNISNNLMSTFQKVQNTSTSAGTSSNLNSFLKKADPTTLFEKAKDEMDVDPKAQQPPTALKPKSPSLKNSPAKALPTTPKKSAAASTLKKRKFDEDDDEDEDDDDQDYEDDDDEDDEDDDDYSAKSKSKTKKKPTSTSATPSKSSAASTAAAKKKLDKEERYDFLVNIVDGNRVKKGDENYDPSTIYVPPVLREKFSPFERQYWDIKSQNYDKVVFFKKGKFYELYESDADLGHQLFDLKMTDRVNMRMVGVPEASFQQWAKRFLEAGHKITKVDQVESRIAMDKRQNQRGASTHKETIIQREVTSILTIGTLVDDSLLSDASANYLMAIKEDDYNRDFAVCFVDCSVGLFNLAEFKDDENRTHLETLLLQTMPKEILYDKSSISSATLSVIKRVLSREKYILTARQPVQFWSPDFVLAKLDEFGKGEELRRKLGGNIEGEHALLGSALGGCCCYLDDIKIADQVTKQARFEMYSTLDGTNSLVLDGQSLVNLEVFANTTDGTANGSLFKVLDRCATPFGKRMLKQWVCRPLSSREKINERLNAVQYLGENQDLLNKLSAMLTRVPDIERMISRIKACSSKIADVVTVLNVLERCQQCLEEINCVDEINSPVLRHYVTVGKGFPNLKSLIAEVRESFDFSGEQLVPSRGLFNEYDECQDRIKAIEEELEQHLKEQKKLFSCNALAYKDIGKELYQIAFPIDVYNKYKEKMGDYIYKSEVKSKVKRYWTPFIEKKVKQLAEEMDTFSALQKVVEVRIQEQFNADAQTWILAATSLSNIDCILSLAKVSHLAGITTCRPEIVDSDHALLDAKDMRHPAITLKGGDDFIPNDITLGVDGQPGVMVLTGPNMGGKSTLLRQCCILVIMAQLGCYVPASSCRLSIVDRIFTRLGANDNIMAGQSTFMLELQETSNVLRYATRRSLVIMDELGRGTSTFDGYSIAYSVLDYISNKINCMCIFATHYQSLAHEPKVAKAIQKSHMSCYVDDHEKKVIFLYKLTEGVCPASYGMLVGGMAGIPQEVINKAEEKADQFEKESTVSTYVHGTTSTKELVRKITQSVNTKDYSKLFELWKTLDLNK